MTSKDLLASASETPAPRGLASLVRAEWFFLVSAASVAAFALFEDRLFSRLDNPLILTAILLWLFGVVLWSSLSVVRHAESLARRFGEPYGTLLLTLTITSIEVVAISAVVRHGGSNPTLMRDTLLAVIMIIMNGMVGATLLIGGIKHREQTFNLRGANAYLSVLLPLATFALIMPDFTQTTPGPIYSVPQQFVLVIVSLALYLLFLVLQTGRYHGYFEDVGHAAAEAQGADAPVWFSTVMLAAYMAAVVYLVEQFGPPIDYLLETLQAPPPLGGILIALLVATPESIGAVKAALDNQMQRAVNISLGLCAGDHRPDDPLGARHQPPHRAPDRPRPGAHRPCAPHPDACAQHDHLYERPHQHAAGRRPPAAVRGLYFADFSGVGGSLLPGLCCGGPLQDEAARWPKPVSRALVLNQTPDQIAIPTIAP